MLEMNNNDIIRAFSRKHGSLGNVTITRTGSTRSEKSIFNGIALNVNGKSIP